jgi:sugar (pentulose or hexulose) kinase
MDTLYGTLYRKALVGDKDCGGLLAYNYFSGEHITHFSEGRPLFVREQNSKFNLANFMRTHLCTSLGGIKVGNDLLVENEGVKVDCIYGHGGLFKTEGVAQNLLAAAIHAPVTVMETAGEGGAWGIALLAAYRTNRANGEALEDYLQNRVFTGMKQITVHPNPVDEAGFDRYMHRFVGTLPAQIAAGEGLSS